VTTVLAAVDIGTNSVHLVVARVGENTIEVLEREREMVRLGSSAGDMKHLTPAAINRGIEALVRFKQVAAIHGASMRAVATSAVREAANRAVFIDRARAEGIEVEVISGFEEARLIHLGVLQAVPVFDRQVLVCDIGGGSTELVVGRGGDVAFHVSTQIGVVRHTERHLHGDPPSPEELDALAADVLPAFEAAVPEDTRAAAASAIAVAGTATQCAAIDLALEPYDPERIEGHRLTLDTLAGLLDRLAAVPLEERRGIRGLDPARAPTIVAGVVILSQALRAFGLEETRVSERDILWGVALDAGQRGGAA
jgi:exopolyphosphatase / guanosine-5'-triphosphate,3'-diphosphate pyrophosphatase